MKKILLLLIALEIAGCAAVPEPVCAKHRCDPSIDEQFKQNASWDCPHAGRVPGETVTTLTPHTTSCVVARLQG